MRDLSDDELLADAADAAAEWLEMSPEERVEAGAGTECVDCAGLDGQHAEDCACAPGGWKSILERGGKP